MTSVSMAACFLGGAVTLNPAASHQRRLVISNSVKATAGKVNCENKQEDSSNGRREMVFAVAAAALCSVAGMALAEEPKRGTPAAKKAYSTVCVANPTARICNY